MSNLGWTIEEDAFEQNTVLKRRIKFTNIIATLNPDAPRRMVIACHYDSKLTPEGFLGATDSAVPCAQMINLAHTMQMDLNDHKADQVRCIIFNLPTRDSTIVKFGISYFLRQFSE
jgi:glutaminyl-peptide cyclotransferase